MASKSLLDIFGSFRRKSRANTPDHPDLLQNFSRTSTATAPMASKLHPPPDGYEDNVGKRQRVRTKIRERATWVKNKFSRNKGNKANNNGKYDSDEGDDDGNNSNNNNGPRTDTSPGYEADQEFVRVLVSAHHAPLEAGRILRTTEYNWPIKFDGIDLRTFIHHIRPKEGSYAMVFEFTGQDTLRDCNPQVYGEWLATAPQYPMDQPRTRRCRRVHIIQEHEGVSKPPDVHARFKEVCDDQGVARVEAAAQAAPHDIAATGKGDNDKKEREGMLKEIPELIGTDPNTEEEPDERTSSAIDQTRIVMERDTTKYDPRMNLETRYMIKYDVEYLRNLIRKYVPYSGSSSST